MIEAYLYASSSHGAFADYFTEQVTVDLIGAGETVTGRHEVAAFIRYAHEQAFDASMVLRSLTVDTAIGGAAIEADFVGRHTGEFAGIEPRVARSGCPTACITTWSRTASRRFGSTGWPPGWWRR
jgi:hypothetical protein